LFFGLYFASIALLPKRKIKVSAIEADPISFSQIRERG
jgi:hypothetical protein